MSLDLSKYGVMLSDPSNRKTSSTVFCLHSGETQEQMCRIFCSSLNNRIASRKHDNAVADPLYSGKRASWGRRSAADLSSCNRRCSDRNSRWIPELCVDCEPGWERTQTFESSCWTLDTKSDRNWFSPATHRALWFFLQWIPNTRCPQPRRGRGARLASTCSRKKDLWQHALIIAKFKMKSLLSVWQGWAGTRDTYIKPAVRSWSFICVFHVYILGIIRHWCVLFRSPLGWSVPFLPLDQKPCKKNQ